MDRCLKRPLRSNARIGVALPILDIVKAACGLKSVSALSVDQNATVKSAARGIDPLRPWQMKKMALLLIGISLFVSACSQESPVEPTVVAPQTPVSGYDGTIVALGDSLTAGLGTLEDQAYPAQLAHRLQADGKKYQVINAGVSGETSSGALSRVEWVISSLSPDIVILETGANDGLRGLDPDLLETNLDRLVSTLTEANIQVILAGMQMLPNLGPEYTRAFSDIYPRIAEKHGVILIPFFLDGVAGQATLNQADKLHPTAEGYARIVETIYPYVVEAIDRHEER